MSVFPWTAEQVTYGPEDTCSQEFGVHMWQQQAGPDSHRLIFCRNTPPVIQQESIQLYSLYNAAASATLLLLLLLLLLILPAILSFFIRLSSFVNFVFLLFLHKTRWRMTTDRKLLLCIQLQFDGSCLMNGSLLTLGCN